MLFTLEMGGGGPVIEAGAHHTAGLLYLWCTSHITTLTHHHTHTSPPLTHHTSPPSHITLTPYHPHTPQDQLPLHIAYTPVSESIHCSALDIQDASCSKKYRASKPPCTMFTIRAMFDDKQLCFAMYLDSSVWVWWSQSGGSFEHQEVNQWPLD